MKRILWVFLFAPLAFGQAVRVDVPIQTSGPNVPTAGGPLPQALWVSNATVAICAHPTPTYAACVAAPVLTYTDSSLGTSCPTTSPIVQLPGTTCSKYAGAAGNLGLWIDSSVGGGARDYYVTSTYGTYGPYTITPGGGGGGGAGNPAPPAFSAQFANSIVNAFQGDSKILINPTLHSFQSPINSGFSYATGYGNGSTNGISQCAAAGLSSYCVADPGYPATEQYTPTSPIPNWPSAFVVRDNRPGNANLYLYHNPTIGPTYGDTNNPAEMRYFQYDGSPLPNTGQTSLKELSSTMWGFNSQPGFSYGNPAVGPPGWMAHILLATTDIMLGSGIQQSGNFNTIKHGIGDTIGFYSNTFSDGGSTAVSDEGTKAGSFQTTEPASTFTAPCTTGCTTGSMALKLTPTGAAGTQGTGRMLIDTTAGATNTTASAIAVGVAANISAVTVAATVPVSVAWGTLASNVAPPIASTAVPPFTSVQTFNVNVTSGAFVVDNTQPVCYVSQTHEQARVTAVGTPSGGVQSVTVATRSGHASGSYIFQGGMCGNGLEFVSKTIGSVRYLFDVVGSTDAHTLQVVYWFNGLAKLITAIGQLNNGNVITGSISLVTLTNSGTTVTATYSGGTLTTPSNYNQETFVITGASDSAFNANCTAATWTTLNTLTCTIAGLSGSHTSASATATLGLNTVNIWPQAMVLDVQNEATTPATVDGTVAIEPNAIVFSPSDTVEITHQTAAQFAGVRVQQTTINPFNNGNTLLVSCQLSACQGGALSLGSLALINTSVVQTDSYYQGLGGFNIAPNFINFSGPFYNGINTNHTPQSGADGFFVFTPTAVQKADANYCYNFFNLKNSSASNNTLNTCPNSGNMTLTGVGTYSIKVPKMDLSSIPNLVMPIITVSTPGGFVSGQGENYAPYSQNIAGPTWRNTGGGSGTTTCAITDDLGNPACTIAGSSGLYNWQDNLSTSGYTAMTISTTYFVHARMQGAVGGEVVQLGTNFLAVAETLTTSWAEYCAPIFTTNSGSALQNFAGFNVNGAVTIKISSLTVSPLSCGPPLPTVAFQYTTPTAINTANTLNSNYYTTFAEFSNGTCTTAKTINPANGNRQNITLTNADTCALTFTQPATGSTAAITLKVIQSAVSTFNGGISGCKWPGGVVPTITATSAAVDFIGVYLDGTNAYCTASQNFQ